MKPFVPHSRSHNLAISLTTDQSFHQMVIYETVVAIFDTYFHTAVHISQCLYYCHDMSGIFEIFGLSTAF